MYEIQAIPTTYAGVNFRSRLEARWAAFFDLVGWRWEYEPIDLPGWAPDFLVHNPRSKRPVLVEVKPIDVSVGGHYRILEDVCAKAFAHAAKHTVVVCGLAPDFDHSVSFAEDITDYLFRPSIVSVAHVSRIGVAIECCPFEAAYYDVIVPDRKKARSAWVEAGNVTQWKKRA